MSITTKDLKGSFAVAFTTFYENGEIDYGTFQRQIESLSKVADGIVLYGMTSEYHKTTDEEKEKLTDIFLHVLKDSSCISVLSVTDWSTEVAVKRAQHNEELGVDALMLMPPFYYGPHIDEIRHHMKSVLEAVKIPVLIQYAPLATKMYLPPEELVAMSQQYPNAAFKIEYRPAVDFMKQFFDLKPDMPIMTGWAGLDIVDLYQLGVAGLITVGGFTEVYSAIFHSLRNGDIDGARAIYNKLEKYTSVWMASPESLLAIEKEIMARRGLFPSSYCRRPAYHLTQEDYAAIDRFLDEFSQFLSQR